jgi:hypothetical protein
VIEGDSGSSGGGSEAVKVAVGEKVVAGVKVDAGVNVGVGVSVGIGVKVGTGVEVKVGRSVGDGNTECETGEAIKLKAKVAPGLPTVAKPSPICTPTTTSNKGAINQ